MKNIQQNAPTRVDREKDGKQELEYGIEDLEKDKIKGGIGDKKDIKDFCPKQVSMGIKVELEHTDDKKVAEDIVKDHLTEDPEYYTKLKVIEKSAIQQRWELLKAKLDSGEAVLDIEAAMQPEQEEGAADDQGAQDGDEPGAQDQGEVQEADMGQEESPKTGEEIDQEVTGEEEQPQEEQPQEVTGEEEQPQEDEEDPQELFKDEMLQMQMQNQGYSQAQIDYILHGHIPASASSEDVKMEADKAMSELKQVSAKNDQTQESQHRQELHDQNKEQRDSAHNYKHEHQARIDELAYNKELLALEREKDDDGVLSDKHHKHLSSEQDRNHSQRMKDLEYETAQKDHSASDLDAEHKKRILDLEYAKAEQEAKLEIKFKEEEYKIKLEQMKQSHDDKATHAKEAHKHKMSTQAESNKAKMRDHKQGLKGASSERQDAAKTSQAEIEGRDKT